MSLYKQISAKIIKAEYMDTMIISSRVYHCMTAAPSSFQLDGINVEVTFQDNENPLAIISFVVCI